MSQHTRKQGQVGTSNGSGEGVREAWQAIRVSEKRENIMEGK